MALVSNETSFSGLLAGGLRLGKTSDDSDHQWGSESISQLQFDRRSPSAPQEGFAYADLE